VIAVAELALAIPAERLREFVLSQRWFGSKSGDVAEVNVLDAPQVRAQPPLLALAVVEVRFQSGTHELYNVPLGFRPVEEGWRDSVVGEADGWTAYDALADPELARELLRLIAERQTLESQGAEVEFRTVDGAGERLPAAQRVRPMGGEQSNSSLVFDDAAVLKLYRRLDAGVNPELELLRFLTAREFPQIAALDGWIARSGQPLDATLAILQVYVAGESDGWSLALAALRDDPDSFVPRARRLGEVTGALHTTLASEPHDPSFSPEEPTSETVALLVATIDESIETTFVSLPADPALEPIAGRGEEIRERLRLVGPSVPGGRLIRHHGDYHLGQVLWTGEDWVVLDFEGEPARPLAERRRKRSPLRDVAGMLRSFSYAASAIEVERREAAPPDWEARVRQEFLDGYFATAEGAILPPPDARERLLTLFELEKAVYELRYELGHRPDWVPIPVRAIVSLLEQPL
jgi:trehalose synthase-fused probable maltokinase